MKLKPSFCVIAILILTSCTTGRLEYYTPQGEKKVACETEYTGAPSVDKYAVEYVLAVCARRATEAGHSVVDKRLLTIDLSVPNPPEGDAWTFELATAFYEQGKLTDKEYGYLIASIDLGIKSESD